VWRRRCDGVDDDVEDCGRSMILRVMANDDGRRRILADDAGDARVFRFFVFYANLPVLAVLPVWYCSFSLMLSLTFRGVDDDDGRGLSKCGA